MIEVTSLCGQICLGKQGENLARMVYFDEPKQWENTFGEGKCELIHQRSGDEAPYPVVLDKENDRLCWKITNADTAVAGEGKCELRYSVDGVVVKSKTLTTVVFPSLDENEIEPPEAQKAWVDQVLDAAEKVETATTHQPIIGENKNWWVWDFESSTYVDSDVSARGTDGHTPVKGVDYYTEADKAEIVSETVEILEQQNDGELSSAFIDERKKVISEVQNSPADFRIVAFADPHSADWQKYKKYNDLLSSGCIDSIVGLGDYQIYSSKKTKEETIKQYTEMLSYAGRTPNCFYAIGNHDIAYKDANGATPNQDNILTKKELFDCLYRHNTTACFNDSDPYGGYFYIDFNAAKIRMIVLNTSDIYEPNGTLQHKYKESVVMQQPQITWLVNTALDFSDKATPADWSVVVCQHAYFDKTEAMIADILSAVKGGNVLDKSWTFKRTLDDPNTTSPDNLLPIELCPDGGSVTKVGVTLTHNDGVFTMKGTATGTHSFELVQSGVDYAELKAGVTYTLALNPVSGTVTKHTPQVYIKTKTAGGTVTSYQTTAQGGSCKITPSEDCTLIRFAIGIVATGNGFDDYAFSPTLMADGEVSGSDESKIETTISANKDYSTQGAVDVVGVLYGHDHQNVQAVSKGIQFIQFICDNNELDDFYVASVNGLEVGDYFFTTNKGIKMGFTLDAALPNAAVIGYNDYFAKGKERATLRFQDANGNTIKTDMAYKDNYADGMTEITGFVQERTPGTVKTESCFVVSVDKDSRTIKIVPYGTGFYKEINY